MQMQYENVEKPVVGKGGREISPVSCPGETRPPIDPLTLERERERDFGVISQTNDAIKQQNKKGKRKTEVVLPRVYHVCVV